MLGYVNARWRYMRKIASGIYVRNTLKSALAKNKKNQRVRRVQQDTNIYLIAKYVKQD